MLEKILRKFGEAEEKVCFDNLMKSVHTICLEKQGEERLAALQDLQKIVLRPVQDEFIRTAYLYPEENSSKSTWEGLDFFTCLGMRGAQLEALGATYKREAGLDVDLSSSLIFAKVLSGLNSLSILGTIGNGLKDSEEFKRAEGDTLLWVEPFSFGFAMSGQLHIAMGIIGGEGRIKPESVLDLSACLNKIRYDGAHFLSEENTVLGKPITPEFGWAWEIQKRGRFGPPKK